MSHVDLHARSWKRDTAKDAYSSPSPLLGKLCYGLVATVTSSGLRDVPRIFACRRYRRKMPPP